MRIHEIRRLALAAGICVASTQTFATPATFNQAFEQIRSRPEYAHSNFGVEIYSLDKKSVLFAWNGEKLFVPGSTTKLLTEGTALQLLGADYRFHTPVYRTGKIENGVLKGNLVLVASGDPDLSGRLQPDGTLAFADEDHSYGGFESKLIGDPLAALKEIARQISAAGIRRIDGQVLVDASLFPEGAHEGGTGMVESPVIVNDNVIDIVASPGAAAGSPANIRVSPQPPYMQIVNKMTTGAAGSKFSLDTKTEDLPHGGFGVTVTGSMPLDRGPYVSGYANPSPTRFAAAMLVQLLENEGVKVRNKTFPDKPTGDTFKASYQPENRVAEHVSAPLGEDVKVTLKTSQNLHAAVMPFVLGAVVAKAKTKIDQAGFRLENEFLTNAGLDLSGASQGDGPGAVALFTPDFMVHYLAYMAAQPSYEKFHAALPVLGKDGTLFNIQTASPAAGHVFAKTGTYDQDDYLNHSSTLTAKGLAGYTTTPSGERVAFAIYVNNVPLVAPNDDAVAMSAAITKVGQTVGEIAAAVNTLPVEATK
jgi:PBP4 family serine-type D-alanyl-D-alanine carboxypeptidase